VTGAFVEHANVPKNIEDEEAVAIIAHLLQMTVIITKKNLVYSSKEMLLNLLAPELFFNFSTLCI